MFYFLSVLIVAFMARGTKGINRTNDFVSESAVFAGPSTGEEVGIGTPQNASSLSAAASSEEKPAMALRLKGRPGAIGQSDRIGLIGIDNRATLELRDQRILNNHKTVLENVEIYRSGRHRQLLNMSKRESPVTNTSGDLPMRIGGVKNSTGGFAYSLGWGGPPRGHRPANLSDPWKGGHQQRQKRESRLAERVREVPERAVGAEPGRVEDVPEGVETVPNAGTTSAVVPNDLIVLHGHVVMPNVGGAVFQEARKMRTELAASSQKDFPSPPPMQPSPHRAALVSTSSSSTSANIGHSMPMPKSELASSSSSSSSSNSEEEFIAGRNGVETNNAKMSWPDFLARTAKEKQSTAKSKGSAENDSKREMDDEIWHGGELSAEICAAILAFVVVFTASVCVGRQKALDKMKKAVEKY